MERITDNNFCDLKDNNIIVDHCQLKWNRSEIIFEGKGNTIYFAGKKDENIILEGSKITFHGNNNLIFICPSKFPLKAVIGLGYGCTVYIGKHFYSTIPVYLMANECSYIHIGMDCLFARDIWLRTSDMHMIYDIETGKRINANKSIYIGKHVWLGQNVSCLKGTVIGNGSVIGYGSLVTGKKTIGVNTIYAGHPAKAMRKGIAWNWKGCNHVTEQEHFDGAYETLNKANHIYTDEKMLEEYQLFDAEMTLHRENMDERIAFLKQYTKMHNMSGKNGQVMPKPEKENRRLSNLFKKIIGK